MKRRLYLLSALLVLGAFALTGCGDKKTEDKNSAPSGSPSVVQDQDAPAEIPKTEVPSDAPDDSGVQETEDIPELEVEFDE